MKVYQIWLLSMNYDLDDGMYDTLVAEFENLEDAQWYFNNCPYGKHSKVNTRMTLEEVELNENHESECSTLLEEQELDSYYDNEVEILDEFLYQEYQIQKVYFHRYIIYLEPTHCEYASLTFFEDGSMEYVSGSTIVKNTSENYLKGFREEV